MTPSQEKQYAEVFDKCLAEINKDWQVKIKNLQNTVIKAHEGIRSDIRKIMEQSDQVTVIE